MPRTLVAPTTPLDGMPRRNADSRQALGLTNWYPMLGQHGAGIWFDLQRGLPGSLDLNAVVRGILPELGVGFKFDGSTSYGFIHTANSVPETAAWTITAWVYLQDVSSGGGTAFYGHTNAATSAGAYSTTLGMRTSKLTGYFYNGTPRVVSANTTLVTNRLYHAAFVADTAANYYKLYLNGLDDTNVAPSTTAAPSAAVNTVGVSFHTNASVGSDFQSRLNGGVGDLRRYNRALSPAEVWQQYDPATRWELYARPERQSRSIDVPSGIITVLQAGGEMLSTSQASLRDTRLEAGGQLLSTTTSITAVFGTYAAGGELVHVVTVPGGTSVIVGAAGGEMYLQTRKYVPADSIPGGLGLAGVGF